MIGASRCLTVATHAFRDTTLHRQASLFQAFKILLSRAWPRGFLGLTLRLVTEMESDLILLIKIALEIDVSMSLRQLFFLSIASGPNDR